MSPRPAHRPPLPAGAERSLQALIALLDADRAAPTTVSAPADAWKVHVADSLSALDLPAVSGARRICDVGAGAGFPGLVLAAALPAARVDLVESTTRKCEFIGRAISAADLPNAAVICERAEIWAAVAGAGAYDLVTARAVGRLSTLAELASPLLADGGSLVAWKGRRDPDQEAELERAADGLAMQPQEVRWVGPYAGSKNRHLHVITKSGPTPSDLPRRPGMAKKRPRGAR